MDLSTVEKKLRGGAYASTNNFVQDVRKIWNNAWGYNQPGSNIYIATTEISNFFEKMVPDLGDVPLTTSASQEIQELRKQVSKVSGVIKKMAGAVPSKSTPSNKNLMNRPMSIQEKAVLKSNIMSLPQEKLPGIIEIIRNSVDLSQNRDTLEFDIDALPTHCCRELEQYVKKNIQTKAKPKKKKPSHKPKAMQAPPIIGVISLLSK
jgi:hypothetical protein